MVDDNAWTLMIAGGSGKIGSTLARLVRARFPDVGLVLAGRDIQVATALAQQLGNARGIAIDLSAPTLPELPAADIIVSAVPDPANLLVDYAIDHDVGHIGITPGSGDIAPLVTRCAHRRPARPIIPLGHYEAGALMPLVQRLGKQFARVDRVEMAALYDPDDPVGAITQGELDGDPTPALARIDGRWERITEEREIGLESEETASGIPLGTLDVTSAAALTGARWVRFDVAMGRSIGTRAGAAASMDLYVDMTGTGPDGEPLTLRMLATDPQGQAHFTAFGILTVVEAVQRSDRSGFTLPELIVDSDAAITAMREAGIRIEETRR